MIDFVRRMELQMRIRRIRDDMSEIRGKILKAQEQIIDYGNYQKDIKNALEKWNNKLLAYRGIPLAAIKAEGLFEGYTANRTEEDIPPLIESISNAGAQMEGVIPGITDQIQKLTDYIDRQQNKITILQMELEQVQAELAALGD